jgi:membrane-bound lytic murein transglycosylase A
MRPSVRRSAGAVKHAARSGKKGAVKRHLRLLAGAVLAAAVACRTAPPPEPARAADGALIEVPVAELPAFGDDLELAGLDEAIGQSLVYVRRVLSADPGRTVPFGSERVPLARVHATLERFQELVRSRPSPAQLDAEVRRAFRVFRSVGDGRGEVLVTGYYLPELRGSRQPGGPYRVPLHRAPDDLVSVRARDFPQLSEDIVGRVRDGRLVPYPTRAEIAGGALAGQGAELLWVDSAVDAFFLEVQGSGIVRLPDGTAQVVTFAGKNGHRYAAVGAELVRRGALAKEQLSMQAIKAWLLAHPAEQGAVLATNPSYVFFRFGDAPTGSIGVPVTAGRTIATDFRVFPKGALAFLASEKPTGEAGPFAPFSRFVLDQDTGGAIRTSARVDLYWGDGAYAEAAAGRMRQPGRLYYLLLR